MLDRMYCLDCKQLFPDTRETRKAQKVITFGQFLYNQQRVMWDEPIRFTEDKKVFQVNCPHCNSMHNVNATELMEELVHIEKRDDKGRFVKGHKTRLNVPKKIRNEVRTIMKDFKYNEQHN